jgi:NAD(P)-dependent dehydrogenase (short-subunit alcohol dehydrogenase family)
MTEAYSLRMESRVCFVTGGSQGMGAEIADAFAQHGATVAIADCRPPAKAPAGAEHVAVDVTDEASVRAAVAAVVARWGRLDVLVNNAGIINKALVEDLTLADWQALLAVNLTGAALCAKHVMPHLKRQRWGRIINLSSIQAFMGTATYSAYATSKAGLHALTRVWARELTDHNGTANSICPAFVRTPMGEAFIRRTMAQKDLTEEEAVRLITAAVPQHRFIEPREVAFVALALCSDLARGITGSAIVVDGGMLMR